MRRLPGKRNAGDGKAITSLLPRTTARLRNIGLVLCTILPRVLWKSRDVHGLDLQTALGPPT